MMCSKDVTEAAAQAAVDSVFDACYNDHEPFP